MSKYFVVSHGLRGCYLNDNANFVKVDTRRELKEILAYEADSYQDAGYFLNKKHIASVAAEAWREAKKEHPAFYDFVIPVGNSHSGDRPFGVFVAVSDRGEYLKNTEQDGENSYA